MPQTKILLDEPDIPTHWYNVVADMPNPPAPPLGPDGKPIGPDALTAIFPMSLIEQEVSAQRWIEIPEKVRTRQRAPAVRFPSWSLPCLAAHVATAQPAAQAVMGAFRETGETLHSTLPHHSSIPGGAILRQHPRQEPCAVIPLAGICAGGGG